MTGKTESVITLPSPVAERHCELNHALQFRRSTREFKDEPISLAEAGRLLWAAQGVTSLGGFRTAPSAGALYPLELYLVAGRVDDLKAGIYKYDATKHSLVRTAEGDRRADLAAASLGQQWMAQAAAILAFSAVPERTTRRYGERGNRYIYMEVGHAGQNASLEAVALGLGAVVVAAFSDADMRKALGLPKGEDPFYLMPVGRK
ncbi:MAG TPA: SagB/ThcOx family dehydrogenase [Kiritimatiellia bacterium]|nr:SagB/ThcOx family dehydrogenase [Kiritimatiellia bacterium]HSA18429.1 SagB/ThcOx family dehydrogenase [Kiritimatiellia bacterium]